MSGLLKVKYSGTKEYFLITSKRYYSSIQGSKELDDQEVWINVILEFYSVGLYFLKIYGKVAHLQYLT